ncbi:Fc.00g072260.m01.CDS01 [Cosmosporella sp. VM-42]
MADNNNQNQSQQQQQTPGLVASHAQYVKGAAEATVGVLTGSQPWKASGEQDKAAGLAAMKRAGEQRDPSQGYGKFEEVAGKVTGCEGMQKEGAASTQKKD